MPNIKGHVVISGDTELKEKLKKLGQAVIEFNKRAAEAGADLILADAQSGAPGPGITSEIQSADENRVTILIGPDKEHWFYQFFETGASKHEIKGSPLAFEGRRGLVFINQVQHPGMTAQPYLRPAMKKNRESAKQKAGEVFRKAIEAVCDGD